MPASITCECILKCLFKTFEKEKSQKSTDMLTNHERRISQRRNNGIISEMKFPQKPRSIKEKSRAFFKWNQSKK